LGGIQGYNESFANNCSVMALQTYSGHAETQYIARYYSNDIYPEYVNTDGKAFNLYDPNNGYPRFETPGIIPPEIFQDDKMYGCAGGSGLNAYNDSRWTKHVVGGGIYGTARGGGGRDNTSQNRGNDGTFYGHGGGGGAFSSSHTYSKGGNGYQGIILLAY
jgi:hypothetical protein